jgi:hypothetical protein
MVYTPAVPLNPKTYALLRALARLLPPPPTIAVWPVVVVNFRPSMHLCVGAGRQQQRQQQVYGDGVDGWWLVAVVLEQLL